MNTDSQERLAHLGSVLRTGRPDKVQISSYWPLAAATHLPPPIFLQIKKKSIDKAKQEERMSKEFAAMEEAALKAYQEDLKRMERESGGKCFYILFK